jgi:hypothetical protein
MASVALGQVQFQFFADLRRRLILKVVAKLHKEFLARDHGVALLMLLAK